MAWNEPMGKKNKKNSKVKQESDSILKISMWTTLICLYTWRICGRENMSLGGKGDSRYCCCFSFFFFFLTVTVRFVTPVYAYARCICVLSSSLDLWRKGWKGGGHKTEEAKTLLLVSFIIAFLCSSSTLMCILSVSHCIYTIYFTSSSADMD